MKKLLLSLLLIHLVNVMHAQLTNLVPNHSFENITNYNYNQNDVIENYIVDWFAVCGEPDLYSVNNNIYQFRAPLNAALPFYQQPNSQNSFIALGLYLNTPLAPTFKNSRETIGIKFVNILKPQTQYYYEYYVNFQGNDPSLSGGLNNLPIKNIDLYISSDSINFIEKPLSTILETRSIPDSFPTTGVLESNILINDTINWVKIYGTFIANGDEQYLYIGNFKPDSLTEFEDGFSNPIANSYYYIDDVLVAESDTILSVVDENALNKFNIYPNPAQNFVSIDIPANSQNTHLSIYNLTGQLIAQKQITSNQQIPISELGNGMYIFVIQSGDKVIGRQRVVVAK